MFYVLGQNFKLFLKVLPGFLSIVLVEFFILCFPEHIMIVWLFKIAIAIFVVWIWAKKIKRHSKLKCFKPSLKCLGIYWSFIIAMMVPRNDEIMVNAVMIGGVFFLIAGMVLAYKALNDSLTAIRKYDPKIKMNTEVHSPDEYFELYSRAENLDMEISKLKKEAPPEVVEAIMQREAGKLIPFLHLMMIYLTILMAMATSWMPVGV